MYIYTDLISFINSFSLEIRLIWLQNKFGKCFFSQLWRVCIVAQSLSHVWLFATPWTAVRQASLPFTKSYILFKPVFIKLVMPSNHLILCCPLFLKPLISSQHEGLFWWVSSLHQVAKGLELQLHHQSFQWMSGLISFTIDWFDLFSV